MTATLMLLSLFVGQPNAVVKISVRSDLAKPVADGGTPFAVLVTVSDGKVRRGARATVRFQAHGYMEGLESTIVGRHGDMKRGVDYRVLPAGGLLSGKPNGPVINSVNVKT